MILLALVYCMICAITAFINTTICKRKINILNVYLLIWSMMVFLYSIRIIRYYRLTPKTWFVLYIGTLIVSVGYMLGNQIKVKRINYGMMQEEQEKVFLKKMIFSFSAVSLFAIIPNTIILIQHYGWDFLTKTSQIYYDNLSGIAPKTIPYLGYFSQAGAICAGIYLAKYGVSKVVVMPIVFSVFNIFHTGSRGNIILTILFALIPMLNEIEKKKRRKANRKTLIAIFLLLSAALTVFLLLTINRSQDIQSTVYLYVSDYAKGIVDGFPAIYKLYQYFTSPIGVLNMYLENPEYAFGTNTFGVIYNLLNKFGMNIDYERYQTFYYVPISANVGTWLRELIMDFGILGMILAVFFFSVLVGYSEKNSIKINDVADRFLSILLQTIFIMTFFVWYFREGFVYVILISYFVMKIVSGRFSKKIKILNRSEQ